MYLTNLLLMYVFGALNNAFTVFFHFVFFLFVVVELGSAQSVVWGLGRTGGMIMNNKNTSVGPLPTAKG